MSPSNLINAWNAQKEEIYKSIYMNQYKLNNSYN